MASLDVSFLLTDPDFTDRVTRITRSSTINQWGEQQLAEIQDTITVVVQGTTSDTLNRLPDVANLSLGIEVWYKGQLNVEAAGGYSDLIVWQGRRYQVVALLEDLMNWGQGWTHAACTMEEANNG